MEHVKLFCSSVQIAQVDTTQTSVQNMSDSCLGQVRNYMLTRISKLQYKNRVKWVGKECMYI